MSDSALHAVGRILYSEHLVFSKCMIQTSLCITPTNILGNVFLLGNYSDQTFSIRSAIHLNNEMTQSWF